MLLAGLAGFALCLSIASVPAADWTITPRVSLGETFTDNTSLAPSGQEESEFITEITPAISVSGEGGRIKLHADYNMRNLIYADDSDRNVTNHRLSAGANAELVKEHLFVDADASLSQRLESPFDPIRLGSDVTTFSLSPYYRQNLAGYADALLRYRYDTVHYEESLSDSNSEGVDVSLNSGREFTRLGWNMNYKYDDLDRATAGDAQHETATAAARYVLGRHWMLLAQGGYEQHDFETPPQKDYKDGSYWAAGLGWAPNRYFGVDVLYGEKFQMFSTRWNPTSRTQLNVAWSDREIGLNSGSAWSGTFTLRTRRSTWQASYMEDTLTYQQLSVLGLSAGFVDILTGELYVGILDPVTGEWTYVSLDGFMPPDSSRLVPVTDISVFPTLTDEVFLRKRAQAVYSYQTGKSSISLVLYDEDREYQESGRKESIFGANANWNWKYAARTTLSFGTGWQRSETTASAGEDDYWYFKTGLNTTLRSDLSGSLTYQFSVKDAAASGRDYEENRITLRATKTF